jgi:hypothetical protein
MRNDLWHRAVELSQFVALVEAGARVDLTPPDGAQIIEIIRRSAAAAGLTFETDHDSGLGLDAVMARAAAEEPGVLPLLSVMLESLYQRDILQSQGDGQRHQLRFATYRDLGELKGAIARRADEVLDTLAATDKEAADALPRLLRSLVTASAQGGVVTSRPARLDHFREGSPEARLIAALLAPQARLLVASSVDDSAEVRLAHESLIQNWPRARDQIVRDQRDLETRSRLESLLHRWKASATPAERSRAILTGLNLAEGSDLVQRWHDEVGGELTGFIGASEQADSWRRKRALLASAAIIAIFAGVSAVATLQWRRAESQTEAALHAKETEAQARATAEQERTRAVANEHRAQDALLATKREAAQTLAAQVQLALRQHDVRRALTLAVQAANTERGALRPTDRPASEPALLQALSQVREVLHVKGASQRYWLPFGFLNDTTMIYADARAGLVQVDLEDEALHVTKIPLDDQKPVNHMAAAPTAGVVALAVGSELQLVDLKSKSIRQRIALPARINSLDVDPAQTIVAAAAGKQVAIVRLSDGQVTSLEAPPGLAANVVAGQVRFGQNGKKLLATYGAAIFEYDAATHALVGNVGQLSGAGMGADQATINAVLAEGTVAFVHLVTDVGGSARAFTFAPLELQALDTGNHSAQSLRVESNDLEFHGVSAIDQEHKGEPTATAAVVSRTRDDRYELQLRYLSGLDGLVVAKGQNLQPPFENLVVSPGDFANQKPDVCRISPNVSFLACQYWTKDTQGIVVWRVLAGTHGLERVVQRYNSSSAVFGSPAGLIAATDKGLAAITEKGERKLADLSAEWSLSSVEGPYVVALAAKAGKAQVFRVSADSAEKASPEIKASALAVLKGQDRAVVHDAERLSLVELASGKTIWTAPIAGIQSMLVKDQQVVIVAPTAAYLIDSASGRILKSLPLAQAADSPVAIDASGRRLAYVGADKKAIELDLVSGETTVVDDHTVGITQLKWSNDSRLLLIGRTDGSVLAWNSEHKREWLIASPFEKSFQASAWPGQPPQGVVLDIALSTDGHRFAVVRQDIANIDIHDVADGRFLTRLSPPWGTLKAPASVTFGPNDQILSSWAVHAMVRNTPRFIMVHRLPRNFEEALALATRRLESLTATWSTDLRAH